MHTDVSEIARKQSKSVGSKGEDHTSVRISFHDRANDDGEVRAFMRVVDDDEQGSRRGQQLEVLRRDVRSRCNETNFDPSRARPDRDLSQQPRLANPASSDDASDAV